MSKDNPWKKTGSRVVYETPWISVTEFEIINPAGKPGTYGTVHFKNIAVGIIALDDEDNITLVGQYRFPIEQYSWEIPAGGCPEGTDPLDSAKRELLEETGLVAKEWSLLLKMYLSNAVGDELAMVYLAKNLSQHQAQPDETEKLQLQRIPFKNALERVMDGEITDAISIAAILKLKNLRSL